MAKDYMLSTNDNPYNPFEQFIPWFLFDIEKGYDCCGRLARIANFSDDMTQKEIDEENERAIDIIVKEDIADIYIKVENDLPVHPVEDINDG